VDAHDLPLIDQIRVGAGAGRHELRGKEAGCPPAPEWLREIRARSLLKKAAGPGVFAGFAFDELG
jgi:hypothetical protein